MFYKKIRYYSMPLENGNAHKSENYQWALPSSQCSPVNDGGHLQRNLLAVYPTWQIPLFIHGLLLQGFCVGRGVGRKIYKRKMMKEDHLGSNKNVLEIKGGVEGAGSGRRGVWFGFSFYLDILKRQVAAVKSSVRIY